jgi:hypothetical protein
MFYIYKSHVFNNLCFQGKFFFVFDKTSLLN